MKQSLRNRCEILTSNGIQLLTVPVQHGKEKKIQTKDVLIDYSTNWQLIHVRALQTAYASAPYFEDYQSDVFQIILKKHQYLVEKNIQILDFLLNILDLNKTITYTESFLGDNEKSQSNKFIGRNKEVGFKYQQIIGFHSEFVSNLSMLDLLFNEGPISRKLLIG